MQKRIILYILLDISDRWEGMDLMENSKVYVNVMAEFTKDGRLLPKSFMWKDGHIYEIQKVKDIRRAASLKAGGVELRYTCIVEGRESHLYYEDNNLWFMEEREWEYFLKKGEVELKGYFLYSCQIMQLSLYYSCKIV